MKFLNFVLDGEKKVWNFKILYSTEGKKYEIFKFRLRWRENSLKFVF